MAAPAIVKACEAAVQPRWVIRSAWVPLTQAVKRFSGINPIMLGGWKGDRITFTRIRNLTAPPR